MKNRHHPLNNAQLELLKLFSVGLSEEELREMKKVLLQFLAAKLKRETDKVWEKKGWSHEDMDRLLHEQLRKPSSDA